MALIPAKPSLLYTVMAKVRVSKVLSGSIALAKRHGKLEKIAANVIYEGDDFSFDIDIEVVVKKKSKTILLQ